jgi:hypothetical protein
MYMRSAFNSTSHYMYAYDAHCKLPGPDIELSAKHMNPLEPVKHPTLGMRHTW